MAKKYTAYSRRSYNEKLDVSQRFFVSHRIVLNLITSGCRVLEIGCANGRFSQLLHEKNCKVTGIEVDQSLAELARTYCVEVYTGDFTTLKLNPNLADQFDVVLFGEVLEHIVDPEKALQKALQLLVPAGKLIVVVPNVAFIGMRFRLLLGDFTYSGEGGILDIGHVRFFTSSTLKRLIEECGYNQVQVLGVPYQFNGNKFKRLGQLGMVLWKISDVLLDKLGVLLPPLFAYKLIVVASR